jgi:hypothetical protein
MKFLQELVGAVCDDKVDEREHRRNIVIKYAYLAVNDLSDGKHGLVAGEHIALYDHLNRRIPHELLQLAFDCIVDRLVLAGQLPQQEKEQNYHE